MYDRTHLTYSYKLLNLILVGGKTTVSGARSSAGKAGVEHEFGWRDVYDIAIRWRQFSEVFIRSLCFNYLLFDFR